MKTMMDLIKRHPLLTYCALAFAVSWGGMLGVVGPGGLAANMEHAETLLLLAYLAMLAGPSLVGIALTAVVDGKAGLRDLLSRLLCWQVGARWYAAALLLAPLVIMAVLLALAAISPAYLPRLLTTDDKQFLLQFSIISALMVGILEELGWTGFAVHNMLQRGYGIVRTGLGVGLVYAAWDSLVVFWVSGATGSAGALPMAIFLPVVLFTWLPTYRVLMVWVYDRTRSVLLAILMQISLIAFWTGMTPVALAGVPLVVYYLILTAALWIVIAAVAAGARQGTRKASRGRWQVAG